MRIGIIGAGHAGVAAADTARGAGAQVTLFSAEATIPYYRPKLVAFAFGQAERAELDMHPAEWYERNGLRLRRGEPVRNVDPVARTVDAAGEKESFDALILCTGAEPILPPFMSGAPACVTPFWTLEDAVRVRERARSGAGLVVVGGGILGVEAALRASKAGLTVTVIERLDRLMAAQFGLRAAGVLADHLRRRGIEVLLGSHVAHVVADRSEGAQVALVGGEKRRADVVLVSVGAQRPLGLARRAGLKTDQGIMVSERLETSAPRVFACGDLAQLQRVRRCSALEANLQGKRAAENAVATLCGEPLEAYAPTLEAVHFAFDGFELHAVGAPADEASEEVVLDETPGEVYRSLVRRNGAIRGVQMVGTGAEFKKYESMVESAS